MTKLQWVNKIQNKAAERQVDILDMVHGIGLGNAEEYSKTAISIPIYPSLKKEEQVKIINYIKLFFNKYE